MSKGGGVGGGGGGSGGGPANTKSRVSSTIPNNVRATIKNIKEIASNHSEDDIYAMLKECNMDPNETTQRLLFLDTFHEVKNKRDKRNENMKSRPAGESRGKPAYQGRGSWGARDSGGRRNAPIRRENVARETCEKGFRPSSVVMNGPMKVPNGSLSGGHEARSSGVSDTDLVREKVNADSDKSQVNADSRIPSVGKIKREVQIQQIPSESNDLIPTDGGHGTALSISSSHQNEKEPLIVNECRTSLPMNEEVIFGRFNDAQSKVLDRCPPSEKVHPPDSVSVIGSSSPQGVEETTAKIEKLRFSDGLNVIIPSHIQVPNDVKNMLIFGSFGVKESHSKSDDNAESHSAAAEVHDETASNSSCEEDAVPAVTDGKHVDKPQAPVHIPERNSPSEPEVSSSATILKGDQEKEDNLAAVGPPFPVGQTAPSYSFDFMPPLVVDPLVQPGIFESLAHVSNSQAGGSPPATTTSPSTPLPVQSTGSGQNSLTPPPSSIALFRHSYPPNYVPYSHYYSPFYPPPPMHQYYGHTTFPTLAPGNMYLPPPVLAAGMKVSPAPYKPGPNVGNQAPIGLPSVYSSYNSAQVSFSPSASVTSGNAVGSEDTVSSLLKENSPYLGHQSEGSTMWVPSAGRDAASFPMNAFVNLPSPGQHLINPQFGPNGLVYHGLQPPMATLAPALTMMQQSQQPMTGPVESVGPHPPNVYQQPVNRNI